MSSAVNIVCSNCLSLNRVLGERIRDKPTCGRCKVRLTVAQPAVLDDTNFDRFIDRNTLPVIVDFWAAWCAPCRAMAPVFEATARARAGGALFAKVDTDSARQTAARFRIQSIPTLIAFRAGREIARQSGALSQPMLDRWLSEIL